MSSLLIRHPYIELFAYYTATEMAHIWFAQLT